MLGACSPGRAVEALRVLADMAAGNEESSLERATPAPSRAPVTYSVDGRERAGDLYRPGVPADAGIVLVPGVVPDGKDDARLVAFATTLARARFAVLVPDIANLRALKIRPEDARDIADAVRHLAGGTDGGVGVVGISYAAGPAVLAALEDDVRGRVRFVVTIGGYYDIEALTTVFTTGYYRQRPGGAWRRRPTSRNAKWVFLNSNTERVHDPGDRRTLAEMARRKLDDLDADVSDLLPGLGREGQAVYALLANDDPERVPALIAALPQGIRADMAALDLKRRDLSRLEARLILVHGRDDPVIPAGESRALAAAAPRASLYVPGSLAHVDLSIGGLWDALTIWRAIYRLLAERDAAPPPAL